MKGLSSYWMQRQRKGRGNRTQMQIACSWQWTGVPSIMEANSLHNGGTPRGHAKPRKKCFDADLGGALAERIHMGGATSC